MIHDTLNRLETNRLYSTLAAGFAVPSSFTIDLLAYNDPAPGEQLFCNLYIRTAFAGSGGVPSLTVEVLVGDDADLSSGTNVTLAKSDALLFGVLTAGSSFNFALAPMGDVIDAATKTNLLDPGDFNFRYLGATIALSTGTTATAGAFDLSIVNRAPQFRPSSVPASYTNI